MEQERYDALSKMSNGDWTDTLISGRDLNWIFKKVLTPKERAVVSMKVDRLVNGEIAIALGVKIQTVERYLYDIEYKYRNGMGRRVDNHPAIRKTKGFIVRRIRTR